MDFKKLSAVVDSLNDPKTVHFNGDEPEVSSSPLDAIDTGKAPAQYKLLILDAKKLTKIGDMSRKDRRDFLAKLSDSQRRQVLDAIQAQRLQDSGFSQRLELLNLDTLLSNCVFKPDNFNKKSLKDFVETATSLSDKDKELVEKILSDEFDSTNESDKELFDSFVAELDAENLPSTFKETVNYFEGQKIKAAEDNLEETVEEAIGDSFKPLEGKLKSLIEKKAEEDAKVMFEDPAVTPKLMDNSIKSFVSDVVCRAQVEPIYNTAFGKAYAKHKEEYIEDTFKSKYGMSPADAVSMIELKSVVDGLVEKGILDASDLDIIADKPFVNEDGTQQTVETDNSVLTLLNNALTELAQGNEEPIKDLVNLSVQVPEEPEASAEPEQPAEEETKPENDEEENFTIDEDFVEDCRQLASGLLSKDSKVNAIIDRMAPKVEALRKYNFRVTDCCGECSVPDQVSVVNPPLSRAEYYSTIPACIPSFFNKLLCQNDYAACPQVKEWCTTPDGCIEVNGCQRYYPYKETLEEVERRLNEAEEKNLSEIISSTCCPLEDAFKMAAAVDCLSFIDRNFYKKHLSDKAWCFDSVPACIKDVVTGPGSIEFAVSDSEGSTVQIFGTYYKVN